MQAGNAQGKMKDIRTIKKRFEREWLSMAGVVGVGIGMTTRQMPGIIISVQRDSPAIRAAFPAEVEGIPVEVRAVGEIKAQ